MCITSNHSVRQSEDVKFPWNLCSMYWVRSSRITSTYALSFNSCFKQTQNTLWRGWWNVDLQVWPSTATQVHSNIKACLLFLFTFMELCTYECVSQGQTVNQHYYTDTLLHLWENVKWKWHDYMDYRILVLTLWQHTYSLCFVCA